MDSRILVKYLTLFKHSNAVSTKSCSSYEGTLQLLHCLVAPVGVAAGYPHNYTAVLCFMLSEESGCVYDE